MTSTRLRKAFRYPDDSGDDIAREELDEEGPLEPCVPRIAPHLMFVSRTRTCNQGPKNTK